jgi:hypothetical protein
MLSITALESLDKVVPACLSYNNYLELAILSIIKKGGDSVFAEADRMLKTLKSTRF